MSSTEATCFFQEKGIIHQKSCPYTPKKWSGGKKTYVFSPYELLYQKKPTYSHLRSFGCLCFPATLKTHKDKFGPRTISHIFFGYPINTKGYKVLNLATKRIHVSRDVYFYETILPFVIAPAGSNFNSVLQCLVPYSNKLPCMSSKTNTFIDDEMLDDHTLDEVTCDQDFISENTPITESTVSPI